MVSSGRTFVWKGEWGPRGDPFKGPIIKIMDLLKLGAYIKVKFPLSLLIVNADDTTTS